jgi:hypothetical protein
MAKGYRWFHPRRNDHKATGGGNGGLHFVHEAQRPPRPPPVSRLERRVYVEVETARQFAESDVPLP